MIKELFTAKELVVFTTRDYASLAQLSVSAASKQLARLKHKNQIVQLTRGIWANTAHPYFNRLACVPALLGREQGYISFLTALHRHGIISQIPTRVQVATTGHSRFVKTPVGNYEFFQLKPNLLSVGIEWSDTPIPYLIATAEKALFDTFYIATRKTRRFAKLPELDLDKTLFNAKTFYSILTGAKLPPQVRAAMERRFENAQAWK